MREIKFKFWDTKEKIMYIDPVNLALSPRGSVSELDFEHDDYTGWKGTDHSVHIIPLQYTGLKDKSGKEIYEGDICRISNDFYYSNEYFNTEDEWELIGEAVKEDYSFKFRDVKDKHASIFFFEADQDSMEIEVIGNIYENPELKEESE